jgi:pyridoxine 4-dehydrogenase
MQTIELLNKTVNRIGYGTMRLPGENVMGPPKDHDQAIAVLKKAVELGVQVIDTAWYYGPDVANELLCEALYPYPDDLIIITKLGGARKPDGSWVPAITPAELRAGMERDLRLLKLEAIPIVHLRAMPGETPEQFSTALDTMLTLKAEGKVQQLGLSTVSEAQLDEALSKTTIATISNPYSLTNRKDDALLDRCAKEGIAYLPYFPLAVGSMDQHSVLSDWATKLQSTPSQLALAWLLKRSPVMLPIPGTSSLAHLTENMAADELVLPDEAYEAIMAAFTSS